MGSTSPRTVFTWGGAERYQHGFRALRGGRDGPGRDGRAAAGSGSWWVDVV